MKQTIFKGSGVAIITPMLEDGSVNYPVLKELRERQIAGEHEVIFAGPEEVITISHSAGSREVFANGALNAAVFLAGKPAGMYNMKDLMHL